MSLRRLPDGLVNRIAAGEVIERPASVVKELVENALDAGARRIRVDVRDGGRALIAITDDGSGMSPEDARLALERHATSKLTRLSDLETVGSFGFRGEALPAIASVSSLRLLTRARGAAEAFELRVEAGRVLGERSLGGPEGTRIEVADLFANVPARRKYLKKATTEWGHVSDWLARSALALPHVHFDLRRDDRPALAWPAVSEPLDRVAAVVGEEDAASFVPVALDDGDATLHGFVSRPDRHRATLAGLYFFVNRRPVRDRLLSHALLEAYRDVLPRGRHPAAVLFLELPGEAVDVNVHPAKWEVRFADPPRIHRLVRRAAGAAKSARHWIAGTPAAGGASVTTERPGAAAGWAGSGDRGWAGSGGRDTGAAGQGDWVFARPAEAAASGQAPEAPGLPLADAGAAGEVRFADQRLLGQLLATYLVLETKAGLLLVDQHAAHERVLYERLRAEWLARGVERQALLVPTTLELEPRLAGALARDADAVIRLGFEVEPFGEGAVVVRAVPALLGERDPASLVRDLADELAAGDVALEGEGALTRVLAPVDRVFATLACHAARRKGDVLDPREQQALLDSLDAIPWAPTCPHGRPVAVPLELPEIERRFARR